MLLDLLQGLTSVALFPLLYPLHSPPELLQRSVVLGTCMCHRGQQCSQQGSQQGLLLGLLQGLASVAQFPLLCLMYLLYPLHPLHPLHSPPELVVVLWTQVEKTAKRKQ